MRMGRYTRILRRSGDRLSGDSRFQLTVKTNPIELWTGFRCFTCATPVTPEILFCALMERFSTRRSASATGGTTSIAPKRPTISSSMPSRTPRSRRAFLPRLINTFNVWYYFRKWAEFAIHVEDAGRQNYLINVLNFHEYFLREI